MNILNRGAMGMTERICWLVPTLGVFMVAVAFYMVVELGSGPYDAIPQIISKYVKKIPYAVIRMIYDLSAIAIGWLLGSTVGWCRLLRASSSARLSRRLRRNSARGLRDFPEVT